MNLKVLQTFVKMSVTRYVYTKSKNLLYLMLKVISIGLAIFFFASSRLKSKYQNSPTGVLV